MSDLDQWMSVVVLGILLLIPSRGWIERRIRSERARRIVRTVTLLLALAAVAVWLGRLGMYLMA
jgi:hypothetical protein